MKKFLGILFAILFTQTICFGLPNPKYLKLDAENSQIKEVARVQKITTDKVAGNYKFVTVTFKAEDKTFTGHCIIDNPKYKGKRLIGALTFTPKKWQTVYVTIKKDGGDITTYQPLSRREAKKFKAMPDKIEYEMGKAYIKD